MIAGAAGKTAETAAETAEHLSERAEAARARSLPVFDYEKVMWNSFYSVGIFGLSWAAIKMGQFLIGITNFLNGIPILGLAIPDETVKNMNRCGAVLGKLDETVGGVAPIVPVGLVGLQASIEYLRIRKNLPEQQRKIGDGAVGLGGLYAVYLAWQALAINPDVPPTDGGVIIVPPSGTETWTHTRLYPVPPRQVIPYFIDQPCWYAGSYGGWDIYYFAPGGPVTAQYYAARLFEDGNWRRLQGNTPGEIMASIDRYEET